MSGFPIVTILRLMNILSFSTLYAKSLFEITLQKHTYIQIYWKFYNQKRKMFG